MFIGPFIWFIPPMAARIIQPDMASVFGTLENPEEGAFIYMGMEVMPVGMMGLLVCGLFAATMSSMDSGLNRNAGIIVRNVYLPLIRQKASEKELLIAGKALSVFFGALIILAGLLWLQLKDFDLFEIMTMFGSMIAIPAAVPLFWGLFIKRAPPWSAWTTFAVGLSFSVFTKAVESYGLFGVGLLEGRERSDFLYLFSGLGNVFVCTLWFFFTTWLSRILDLKPPAYVEQFFEKQSRPVDAHAEENKSTDRRQTAAMAALCLVYAGFIALMALVIPNSLGGRMTFLFCGGVIGGLGWWLKRHAARA
jgi:Na+/proline symporter